MRDRIQERLVFIDIDDYGTKELMEKAYEKDSTWKDKEILVLPAFDLYRKKLMMTIVTTILQYLLMKSGRILNTPRL